MSKLAAEEIAEKVIKYCQNCGQFPLKEDGYCKHCKLLDKYILARAVLDKPDKPAPAGELGEIEEALEFARDYMCDEDWSIKWPAYEWYEPPMNIKTDSDPVELLALALHAQTGWRSVEEMPEKGGLYDVGLWHPGGGKFSASLDRIIFDGEKWETNSPLYVVYVWRENLPLPEPPERNPNPSKAEIKKRLDKVKSDCEEESR